MQRDTKTGGRRSTPSGVHTFFHHAVTPSTRPDRLECAARRARNFTYLWRASYGEPVDVPTAPSRYGAARSSNNGFRALMMNVVGMTRARATEYQRAGSAWASVTAAGLSGVSTNASI